MEIFLIAHILGDFYFQSQKIAQLKRKSKTDLYVHVAIYTAVFLILSLLAYCRWIECVLMTLLVGITHYLIDYSKVKVETNFRIPRIYVFFVDQLLHIFILWLAYQVVSAYVPFYWIPTEFDIHDVMQYVAAILVCGKPASIMISLFFKYVPKTIEDSLPKDDKVRVQEIARIGSWIGVLERQIILILATLGQYGAIGFVLTAKSIARHKQLNEPAFAEKYLLGTLLSSFIALICSVLCTLF